jgi:tetratricopeptide (TPR) repeat protein
MSYYDRVLAINPSDNHAFNNKGNALEELGNYTGAILYYDKALAIDPEDVAA